MGKINRVSDITFFKTPSEWRKWLQKNHNKAEELWVGFYKKDSGKPSITWPESVDQALCFGWIDGVRKSLGDISYVIRFTPRKSRSIWSMVNIKRAKELSKLGLMRPAGLEAFNKRDEKQSNLYSYENRTRGLESGYEKKLKADKEAWEFFRSQAPSYQHACGWWVMSAKKEETRLKRLSELINVSKNKQTVRLLTSPNKRGK
ncbi:MAG: YdeI/OmpD-associated family protein [Ignavibacteriales bacterium]|nr:YdeI/OmpD-associated family protein [Ignavibacteriales bacterium]